jgi:chromosome segregation ATPase
VNVDIDALCARVRARHTIPVHERDPQAADDDVESLLAELEDARAAVKRLTEEDDDLRESVEIWIRLYDANLRRANRAEAEVKRLRRDLPDNVQQLFDVLDRVGVLREAVTTVVSECQTCARQTQDCSSSRQEAAAGACGRCLRALEALQAAAGLVPSEW